MVDNHNIESSFVCEPSFRRTLHSASLGFPQAISELAQAYILVRNFSEAIAWSRTLAEDPNLIADAITLLDQIPQHTGNPIVLDEVYATIAELSAQMVAPKTQVSIEKHSFLMASLAEIED